MKEKIKKLLDPSMLRYILVGIINTLVGTGIMYGLRNLLPWTDMGFAETSKWPFWISSGANYVLTSILSFFLNKYFTFRNREKSWGQVLRFALNIAVCYLLAYGIAKPAVKALMAASSETARDNVSMFVGMCLFTVLNYCGQRFFAFRGGKSGTPAEGADGGEKS